VVGSVLAIVLTVAIDSIKGLNLFNIFQSVLSFIAPPMTAVFLLGVFWSRATTRAANLVLTAGTAFCLIVGILYLWGPQSDLWPHFMMLSFLLCLILIIAMIGISMIDKQPSVRQTVTTLEGQHHLSRLVVTLWLLLAAVMIGLYIFFN
jgi:SSS family solute:Na+ symporter